MSLATSIRGKEYEDEFIKCFLVQNIALMKSSAFYSSSQIVYDRTSTGKISNKTAGDIDAMFVPLEDVPLSSLLPFPHSLKSDVILKKNSRVYFELTTQEGINLSQVLNRYIRTKVAFHKKLVNGEVYGIKPCKNHFLVFVFNGADHNEVEPKFQELCRESGIRGTTVYIASKVMSRWASNLEITELNAKLVQAAEEARAKDARIAELESAANDRAARKALKRSRKS